MCNKDDKRIKVILAPTYNNSEFKRSTNSQHTKQTKLCFISLVFFALALIYDTVHSKTVKLEYSIKTKQVNEHLDFFKYM